MSEAKWTPGDWLVEDDPDIHESTLATVAWCGAYRIGIETGVKGGNYRDGLHGDEEADAHLIAAAPGMADALRQWQHAEETGDERELQNARHSRDAALAQARGDQS